MFQYSQWGFINNSPVRYGSLFIIKYYGCEKKILISKYNFLN